MKRHQKKQRHLDKSRKRSDNAPKTAADTASKKVDRRQMLLGLRNWSVVGIVGIGIGWYLVDDVTASIAEHDLSRIGNGKMTVVQVHDPQCQLCRALQRETRSALKRLDDPNVQYLVANIKVASGRQFAAKHRVGHVTLVLLDGKGRRKGILGGNRNSREVYEGFRTYFRLSKNRS